MPHSEAAGGSFSSMSSRLHHFPWASKHHAPFSICSRIEHDYRYHSYPAQTNQRFVHLFRYPTSSVSQMPTCSTGLGMAEHGGSLLDGTGDGEGARRSRTSTEYLYLYLYLYLYCTSTAQATESSAKRPRIKDTAICGIDRGSGASFPQWVPRTTSNLQLVMPGRRCLAMAACFSRRTGRETHHESQVLGRLAVTTVLVQVVGVGWSGWWNTDGAHLGAPCTIISRTLNRTGW
jgi:hypothetical protein